MNYRPLALCGVALLLTGCASAFHEPIDHAASRATPLGFGMHVTPDAAHNPIQPPERFAGYHVGLDFEVSKDELERDVPIYAICGGEVIESGFADGYGGLIVHRCRIKGEDVTVIYGHLAVDSLPKTGTTVTAGQQIGILGAAHSHDTDGNRKHLHLGIHRGKDLVVLGYVQTEGEIADFIDPLSLIPQNSLDVVQPRMEPYWQSE